ncbi:MAG TPA: DUF1800 domain-containing protein [Planctomycetota bacterium]|nr:DUF1800 domain-containing protein [Planctomycetota bacterium]
MSDDRPELKTLRRGYEEGMKPGWMTTLATLGVLVPLASAHPVQSHPASWDARAVEHLYNRAGFGARPSEIEAGVAMGKAALVENLVTKRVEVEPFFWERIEIPDPKSLRELPADEQREKQREFREKDRRQLLEYTGWWYDRLASGEDPLRERMVLFWHGFFTSSVEDVKRNWLLIQQNQLVRDHALGSYAELLSAMLRDPAMLTYLDNQVNRKGNPNENLARELMELFSLGVGNYTEEDVKEAARALTGRGINRDGEYELHPRQHDDGKKTILGKSGKFDGDDLVAILLKQEACSKWVSRRLIAYFEGVAPSPDRVAAYATFLREHDYQLQPFLKRLFLDPAFYRDEVVGARVQGPVDFMVGLSRRLGVRVPPIVLGGGSALLGQRLFAPPSVKGWEEGEPWITTATLMQRGNLAGLVLGVVKVDDVMSGSDLDVSGAPDTPMAPGEPGGMDDGHPMGGDDAKPPAAKPPDAKPPAAKPKDGKGKGGGQQGSQVLKELRRIESSGWVVPLNFSARMAKAGARTDAEIADRMVDDLLAIRAPDDTRARMREFLAHEREDAKIVEGKLLDAGGESERILRRLAHLVLSLPEAQLE